MKIKKNDNVKIISGKDRGKSGKVLKILPEEEKLVIEGINLKKKHSRPKKQGQKGQIIQIPAPMHISNVMLVCPSCEKPARTGYKVFSAEGSPRFGEAGGSAGGENKKTRVCKKCGSEI